MPGSRELLLPIMSNYMLPAAQVDRYPSGGGTPGRRCLTTETAMSRRCRALSALLLVPLLVLGAPVARPACPRAGPTQPTCTCSATDQPSRHPLPAGDPQPGPRARPFDAGRLVASGSPHTVLTPERIAGCFGFGVRAHPPTPPPNLAAVATDLLPPGCDRQPTSH